LDSDDAAAAAEDEPVREPFAVLHGFGRVDWGERGTVATTIQDLQHSPKPWVRSVLDVLRQYDAEAERDVVWTLDCARDTPPGMFSKTADVLNCAFCVGYRMAKHRKLLRRVVSEVRVVCHKDRVDALRSTVAAVLDIIPSPRAGQRQVSVRVMTPEQAHQLQQADAVFSGASS